MNGLKSLLRSRKVWLTASGILTVVFQHQLGLSPEDATKIAMLVMTLVGGITIEDAATKSKTETVPS